MKINNKGAKRTLIGCALLYFSMSGIAINCRGVFFTSMAESFGVSLSRLTMYILISGIASALLMKSMCGLFQKYPTVKVLLPFTLIHALSLVMMASTDSLTLFYVYSTVQGIINGFIVYYPIQYAIGNWFPDRKGTFLGIVLMTAGLAGTVMNPVLERFISLWGWKKAFIVSAAIVGGLSVAASLLIRKAPSETGDSPVIYGNTDAKMVSHTNNSRIDQAFHTIPLFVMLSIISLFAGLAQQYPAIAEAFGRRTSFGALLVSVAMTGNMIFKPLFGISNDRLGTAKTTGFTLFAGAISAVGTATGIQTLMLIGAFLFGACMPMQTVAPPLLFEAYFTDRVKSEVYPHVCSVILVISSLSQPFLSLSYELAGSYRPVLIACALVFALSITIICYLNKKTAGVN